MTPGSSTQQEHGWETLSIAQHYQSAHLSVATHVVRTPSRPHGQRWTIAHRKRAAIVAAITAGGELLLIRQERIPIRTAIWEVPGGQIDDATDVTGATAGAVALEELREETGYELAPGGELLPLGDFFPSPGFTDEHSYFFVARPVQRSAAGHAHGESESILDCGSFTARRLREMIANNEIRDANTLGIYARLIATGLLPLDE